jgi:hypothetical protein
MFLQVSVFAEVALKAFMVVGMTMWTWKQSKLPEATAVIYLAMSLYTLYAVTRCCYDQYGPEGLPHCYH